MTWESPRPRAFLPLPLEGLGREEPTKAGVRGPVATCDGGATYGPIGAVVGVMLWFFVSVYAVLLGAELNAQLEGRAAR
jgi:Virulence factor BrkB